MTYRLVITIEARNDELQAYMYYESVLPGLGERFLKELEDVYHILSHHPNILFILTEPKRFVTLC